MNHKLLDYLYQNSIEYLIHWRKHTKEYFWAIIIVLALRSTVGVVYRIPTGSMIPTFRVGDMLVANRFYYGLKLPFTDELEGFRLPAIRELEVGDVVIFLGPREEIFYDLLVDLGEGLNQPSQGEKLGQARFELLQTLNRASRFKRAISPISVFNRSEEETFFYRLLEGTNYIFNNLPLGNWGNLGNDFLKLEDNPVVVLHLHEQVYLKYQKQIEQQLKVISSERRKSSMTYEAAQYKGFFYQLLSVPIAGFSIIMDVLIDTPFFWAGKLVIHLWSENEFDFYPNPWTDQSKEYVKRLIAKEGDKVEIINKKVYINDRPLEWDQNFRPDPYRSEFFISKETLPHSPKKDSFKHPIRFSAPVIEPFFKFDRKLWPYEPDSNGAIGFRDSFGPIIVPEGHYFMMGDNRDESQDSRYFGTVPKWAVKGTPMYIFYPWSRRGLVQ